MQCVIKIFYSEFHDNNQFMGHVHKSIKYAIQIKDNGFGIINFAQILHQSFRTILPEQFSQIFLYHDAESCQCPFNEIICGYTLKPCLLLYKWDKTIHPGLHFLNDP